MLAGILFVVTMAIVAAFSWQAAPENWKSKAQESFTRAVPVASKWSGVGWHSVATVWQYLKRPEARIYFLPVILVGLVLWFGMEAHPYNTGSILEVLYHPQSLVGLIAFVIWRSSKNKPLKKSYIRNIGGIILLWACLWYLLYFLRLDPPSFYNGIYDGLLTIATLPILFGIVVVLVARRNTEDVVTKRIVTRTILMATVAWTALGPFSQYVKYSYMPSISESDLQEMRRYTTPTNRILKELECERQIDLEERNYSYDPELRKVTNRTYCTFVEYQVDPWLRRDLLLLDLAYNRVEDSLYDMSATW